MPGYTFRDRVNKVMFGVDPGYRDVPATVWWTMEGDRVRLLHPDEDRVELTREDAVPRDEASWDTEYADTLALSERLNAAAEGLGQQIFTGIECGITNTLSGLNWDDIGLGQRHEPQFDQCLTGKAIAKSKNLLISYLSLGQKEEFEKHNYFTVVCPSGNKYQVQYGTAYNVYRVNDSGVVTDKFCTAPFLPNAFLPIFDIMLSQMLMLETDEQKFLQIANRSDLWTTFFRPS